MFTKDMKISLMMVFLYFQIGINDSGEIQYIDYTLYEGNGYTTDETLSLLTTDEYYNCYTKERWNFQGYDVLTDMAKNTFCRAPGTYIL